MARPNQIDPPTNFTSLIRNYLEKYRISNARDNNGDEAVFEMSVINNSDEKEARINTKKDSDSFSQHP